MKARDVRSGDTVMCCQRPWPGHTPRPVTVTKLIRPDGSRRIAFGYDEPSGAAKDTNGITGPYDPDDEVRS